MKKIINQKLIEPLEEILKDSLNLKENPTKFADEYMAAFDSIHLISKHNSKKENECNYENDYK